MLIERLGTCLEHGLGYRFGFVRAMRYSWLGLELGLGRRFGLVVC